MSQATEVAAATVLAVAGLVLLGAAGLVWVISVALRATTRPRGPHTHIPAPDTRKENRT